MPARRKNDKDWQKDVPTEDEKDILEEWVCFRQWEKDGCWRPLSDIQSVPKIRDVHAKRDGLLVLTAEKKWNLYFSKDASFSFEEFRDGIGEHPLTALGRTETAKMDTYDHLSHSYYGFRCRRNFSVRAGYTQHGDVKNDRRLT